ncbi:MAG: phosphoglucosamine mutase [Candidatus Micrarchaeota archaeon]|nr:phosphoglucosamine mutase [Candidatus Micrarchaeota archaeon]
MLFGTNGIRGKLNELDSGLVFNVCYAFAKWTYKKTKKDSVRIAVAKDMRLTGDFYKSIAIAGLLYGEAEVIDIGITTSPTAEYYLHSKKLDGLVIITASHNPPEYNALKFVDYQGIPISPEKGLEIESEMKDIRSDWKKIRQIYQDSNANLIHANAILNDVCVNLDKNFLSMNKTVFFDPGNGTSALIIPHLMNSLNIKTISINAHLDGTFPGRMSEPTANNLKQTLEFAKSVKYDYGIALDGDADRLIMIDEKSNFISGDKVCALGAIHTLSRKKGNVVTTVATSNVLRDVVNEYGGKLIYTKVGAPYIVEKVIETNSVFAGEEVGGLINPTFSLAKDGPYWCIKILELFQDYYLKGKKFSDMVDELLPKYYNEKLKTYCKHSAKKEVMKKVINELEKETTSIIAIDGVRADLNENEWVLIRASGTEEFIRVFAEAKTQEKATSLAKNYLKLVENIISKYS